MRMIIDKNKVLSNGVVYFISSILTQSINLILIPLYTRNLSQEQYGQFDLISSVQQFLSIMITLGVFSGMMRFFNEFDNKQELKNTSLTFSLIWGTVCISLVYLINPFIADHLFNNFDDSMQYLPYTVITSILVCLVSIYSSFYSMQFKAFKSSAIQISTMLFTLLFALFFLRVVHGGVLGILKAQLYANLLVFMALFIADLKHFRFRMRMVQLKKIIRYGLGFLLGDVSSWALALIDRFFIKGLINLSSVAVYSIAYKIGMLINPVLIVPFTSIFTPFKFKVYKEEEGKEKLKKVFNMYNFIGWFCIIGLSLFARILIKILATDVYLHAFYIIPIIAFSYFLWGIGAFYSLGLHISNKMLLNSIIVIIAAVTNIIANILLIPPLGISGAALSTVLAYMVANALFYRYSKKYYHFGLGLLYPYKYIIVFVILYAPYLLFVYTLDHILLEVLLNGVLCAAFFLLSIAFGFISKEELNQILNKIRSKKNKFYYSVYGYGMELPNLPPKLEESSRSHAYELQPMTLEVLERMRSEHPDEMDEDKHMILRERILYSVSETGYVVTDQEGICGYFHLTTVSMNTGIVNKRIALGEDGIGFFDDYTFERHRGKGIHKFSVDQRIRLAVEMGYSKAIVFIYAGNTPSEKTYQQFGFLPYINYKAMTVGKYKRVFIRGVKDDYKSYHRSRGFVNY